MSPILAPSPTEIDLIEGQNLILNCIVLMGTPKPLTKWYKNGVEISKFSEHMEVQEDGSLILRGGSVDQQGLYSCKAENVAGNASLDVHVRLISEFKIK